MVALYFKALRKLIFNRKHHQQFTPYGYQTGASPSSLQQLLRYCELCHFEYNGSIPATYPHLLSFSLQLKIVTDSRFPVSLAGLVHTKNIITQYWNEVCDAAELTEIDKKLLWNRQFLNPYSVK